MKTKQTKKTAAPKKGPKVTAASKAKAAAIRASLAKPAKGKTAKPATNGEGPRKESKLALCVALLTRKEGCTTRDLLTATGWPAISVPATAKAGKLKLRKEKTKGSPSVYFGSPA